MQDKSASRRVSNTAVAQAVRWVRAQVRGVPTHTLIWTLIACSATFCLLQGLRGQTRHTDQTAVTNKAAEKVDDLLPDLSEEKQAKEDESEKNTEDEEEEENEQKADSENDDEEELVKKDESHDESF